MELAAFIIAAFLLDQLLGDPRWLPHPINGMAKIARICEKITRRIFPAKLAGIITVLIVTGVTGFIAWGILALTSAWHPLAEAAASIWMIYTGIATRDLIVHSKAVHTALAAEDLPLARQKVGMIVGRDTAELDEAGVARACVESVAENTVDGIISPLFFAAIGGPIGIMVYKAVSTMDSLFGYKNETYKDFGWAPARLDDVANYICARFSIPVIAVASALIGQSARGAWQIGWRDRNNHASPNSAHSEAAVAGALQIQLGGPSVYRGILSKKPYLGEPTTPIHAMHVLQVNSLVMLASELSLILFCTIPFLIGNL